MTTNHTRGPWRIGKCYGAVVADVPVNAGLDNDHPEAYGGHLIAESVAVCNQPLIATAPELLELAISNAEYRAARDSEFGRGYNAAKNGQPRDTEKESADWYAGYAARAAIAKAKGEQL